MSRMYLRALWGLAGLFGLAEVLGDLLVSKEHGLRLRLLTPRTDAVLEENMAAERMLVITRGMIDGEMMPAMIERLAVRFTVTLVASNDSGDEQVVMQKDSHALMQSGEVFNGECSIASTWGTAQSLSGVAASL